ncbi:MAG: hypothetical protein NTAFB01_36010 [Nitrospira sp.]
MGNPAYRSPSFVFSGLSPRLAGGQGNARFGPLIFLFVARLWRGSMDSTKDQAKRRNRVSRESVLLSPHRAENHESKSCS